MIQRVTLLFLVAMIAHSQYNSTISFSFAKLSQAAYSSQQEIQTWTCKNCLKHIQNPIYFSVNQQLQGFAAYCQLYKVIVVSIRGTAVTKNWLANFKIAFSTYNDSQCINCTVHTGFNNYAKSLENPVSDAVNKLFQKYGKTSIVMTGHSLGGALSTLVGLSLKKTTNTSVDIYTFGAPRVGNTQFSKFCGETFKSSFRIVNEKDGVPHLLPKKFGYRHADIEIWYKSKDNYKVCYGDRSNACSNSVYLMLLNKKSHKLENYIALFDAKRQMTDPKTPETGKLKASLPLNLIQQEMTQESTVSSEQVGLEGFEIFTFLRKYNEVKDIGQLSN